MLGRRVVGFLPRIWEIDTLSNTGFPYFFVVSTGPCALFSVRRHVEFLQDGRKALKISGYADLFYFC